MQTIYYLTEFWQFVFIKKFFHFVKLIGINMGIYAQKRL